MTCSACGGDGLIEYGAYRGDEGVETRECHLCGGVVTSDGPLERLAQAAAQAGASMGQIARTLTVLPAAPTFDIEGSERARQIREGRLNISTLQRVARIGSKWNKRART